MDSIKKKKIKPKKLDNTNILLHLFLKLQKMEYFNVGKNMYTISFK